MKLETGEEYQSYYVPAQSHWPIVGAIALFLIAVGAGLTVMQLDEESSSGLLLLLAGFVVILYMLFGWFKNVITESMSGRYSKQMDLSFRQAMLWFIFSEVMFFFVFFGALFYARNFAVPWLAGESNNAMTNALLWAEFEAAWPLLITPAGETTQAMSWAGLPLINTLILLTSSVTLHIAHSALIKSNRAQLQGFLALSIGLGVLFLILQGYEYIHAYQDLGLTLQSGIYGNTFYLLTGFHGLHVTLGAIILFTILLRIFKGHFNRENHFAFEAAAWYWHFVDVVWLCLFVFVYIL